MTNEPHSCEQKLLQVYTSVKETPWINWEFQVENAGLLLKGAFRIN